MSNLENPTDAPNEQSLQKTSAKERDNVNLRELGPLKQQSHADSDKVYRPGVSGRLLESGMFEQPPTEGEIKDHAKAIGKQLIRLPDLPAPTGMGDKALTVGLGSLDIIGAFAEIGALEVASVLTLPAEFAHKFLENSKEWAESKKKQLNNLGMDFALKIVGMDFIREDDANPHLKGELYSFSELRNRIDSRFENPYAGNVDLFVKNIHALEQFDSGINAAVDTVNNLIQRYDTTDERKLAVRTLLEAERECFSQATWLRTMLQRRTPLPK